MPIPESQLETWANPGATVTAKATADSIKNALNSYDNWPEGINVDPYLQGSYKNDTNIYGDMDVDVVAQLNSPFYSNLNEEEKRLLGLTPASYNWSNFRSDVLKALQKYYGASAITEGNKVLKVNSGTNRLPADVVICTQYKRYKTINKDDYVAGMCFWTRNDNRRIINHPKIHSDNGVKKNSQSMTNGWFKPTVRVFKNIRTYLIDKRRIAETLAPSYFLECLIYNAPNYSFGSTYQSTLINIIKWFVNLQDKEKLVCQNEQFYLFGNGTEQWTIDNALSFFAVLIDLYEEWQ